MLPPAKPFDSAWTATVLAAVRSGEQGQMGDLLEGYRQYLLHVASAELDPQLRAKVGASDLVQQTFLVAARAIPTFEGDSEAQLRAWLCSILRSELGHAVRDFRATAKRQLGRELPLDEVMHRQHLAQDTPSPSQLAAADEEAQALRRALEQLPRNYRLVVQWRSFERLSFEEIGRRLDRSAEAARKLWSRAVEQLAALHRSTPT